MTALAVCEKLKYCNLAALNDCYESIESSNSFPRALGLDSNKYPKISEIAKAELSKTINVNSQMQAMCKIRLDQSSCNSGALLSAKQPESSLQPWDFSNVLSVDSSCQMIFSEKPELSML